MDRNCIEEDHLQVTNPLYIRFLIRNYTDVNTDIQGKINTNDYHTYIIIIHL